MYYILKLVKLNSNFFLSASMEHTIKLWNINKTECEFTFTGHSGLIYRAVAIFDDNYFISGGNDKKIIM